MSQNLPILIQGMREKALDLLESSCLNKSEAKRLLAIVHAIKAKTFNNEAVRTELGISITYMSQLKRKLYDLAVNSIAFSDQFRYGEAAQRSPESKCMQAITQAQVLLERDMSSEAHYYASKAAMLVKKHQLFEYRTLVDSILLSTRPVATTTTGLGLYANIASKTTELAALYALKSHTCELVGSSPFTTITSENTARFERVLSAAQIAQPHTEETDHIADVNDHLKAQMLLFKLWNIYAKLEPDALDATLTELETALVQLKPHLPVSEWALLQLLKVAGAARYGRIKNVASLASTLGKPRIVTTRLYIQPLRQLTEQLILQRKCEDVQPLIKAVLDKNADRLTKDETAHWRLLRAAVAFNLDKFSDVRYILLHVTGYKKLVRLEIDILNLMAIIEQRSYFEAELYHDAFRKRVQRGGEELHERYRKIATLFKFLIRLGFGDRKVADLDTSLITKNPVYHPTQLQYFEIDFEPWCWEQLRFFENNETTRNDRR